MTKAKRDVLIAIGLAALLALVPLVVGTRYIITQMTLFFIWAIVVTQWNLVLGVAGIFSLAQMALFAVAPTPPRCWPITSPSRSSSPCLRRPS